VTRAINEKTRSGGPVSVRLLNRCLTNLIDWKPGRHIIVMRGKATDEGSVRQTKAVQVCLGVSKH
jgi:hypothetical protein